MRESPRPRLTASFAGCGRARGMNGSTACCGVLIAAAALLLFQGCTPWRDYWHNGMKVGPEYHTPPAAVAENWIDEGDRRIHTTEPDLRHWWTAFDDDQLTDLIHAAYHQNLTLREAGWRILQARAMLAIAEGYFYPQQQAAVGDYSRIAISTLAANREFMPTRFYDQWDLGFNLAWELDFWGRFRRAIEAAEDELEASVFNYDDVLVTLLGDVAIAYVQMRTIEQQIEYVQENVKIQRLSLDIAKARFRGGLTSDLDVEQAASQLAQTEALIPQFRIRLRQVNNRLCVLLGMPTVDLTKQLPPGPIPTAPPEVAIGVPADLLRRRPDVRRAEREVAAQCARIGVAESDLYPHIAITGTVGFEAQTFSELFKNYSLQGDIGPGFQWNVLNYGRLISNVILHDARFRELVVAYQNAVLNANADVENGLVEFLESQVRTQAMQRSVDAASKAVQLAITQYKAGLVDFNRVALLEQNLVQQQDLLAQAQGDIAIGLVRVYRALGGGWEIRCEPVGYDSEHAGPAVSPEAIPAPRPLAEPKQSVPGDQPPKPDQDVVDPALKPVSPERKPPPAGSAPESASYQRRLATPIPHAGLLPQDRGEVRYQR